MKLRLGDCFQNAVNYIWEHQTNRNQMELVHGHVTGLGGGIEGVRYTHAWIEDGDVVIDPSMNIDKPVITRKEVYYKIGQVKEKELKRYGYDEMNSMLLKHGEYGAWELQPTKEESKLLQTIT